MDSLGCVSLILLYDCYYSLSLKVKNEFELKNKILNNKPIFKLYIL